VEGVARQAASGGVVGVFSVCVQVVRRVGSAHVSL
jgi:hypothetical protein